MNYEGMVVDREKTTHYYKELSIYSLCDCDYCRLYHSKSKTAYPELTDWLMQCGIDIEKPFETMWLVSNAFVCGELKFSLIAHDNDYRRII